MSAPTELWKKWEGQVVDGKFPLLQWLGGSDHSAVFLTEHAGQGSQKAAVKLIPVGATPHRDSAPQAGTRESVEADAQLARWAEAAKLSHPRLIRLLGWGRCQIDDTFLLYVVMEYAEENLAEVLPLRALSGDEAREMLRPAAEGLTALHRASFVHGHIKPSNILAVDNQLKLSTDGLGKAGDRGSVGARSFYDAPEVATDGQSAKADIWSLGITLVVALTQNQPKLEARDPKSSDIPDTIPQPLREILRRCLQLDPRRRCGLDWILDRFQGNAFRPGPRLQPLYMLAERSRPSPWAVGAIVVASVLLATFVGSKFVGHQPAIPTAENRGKTPAEHPATQLPTPFATPQAPVEKASVRGSVLQQVMPDVSKSALNTIDGRVKVSVQVEVDSSGNVSQAKLISPAKSKYFDDRTLAAARRWKFNPAQLDGRATSSEWILRFQFRRTGTEVFPAEIKP
jgi:TonB family protein